jgi:TRAP-type C4-dicarboxylate transport system permease small subunit
MPSSAERPMPPGGDRPPGAPPPASRLLRTLHAVEDGLLAALLGSLLLLAVTQIALRVFVGGGLDWAEPVSRVGVLWLALLGALGATRTGRHIAIDALPRVLSPRLRRVAWIVTQLASAGVCATLAWTGWGMVAFEREAPSMFVPGVPSWWPMLAFPAGFALIALRFAIAAFGPPAEPGAPPEVHLADEAPPR